MYHYMHDGSDWFWFVPMTLLWIAVLAGVIYAAVRLAMKHGHDSRPPLQR